ncbi:hypothetical protein niasHT_022186 [Heterodera trifolii]|uniref:Uncharacterized protein n=1 Tax=Heterodera trifolii TaxID=157864 RepID=A0ABD2JWA9_9BILA
MSCPLRRGRDDRLMPFECSHVPPEFTGSILAPASGGDNGWGNEHMEEQGAAAFVDVVVHPDDLFVNRTHSTSTFVYQAGDKILQNNSLRHRMAISVAMRIGVGSSCPNDLEGDELGYEEKELRIAHQKRRRTEDEYHLFLWWIIPSRIRGECSCGPLCLHFSLPDLEDICIGQFGKIDVKMILFSNFRNPIPPHCYSGWRLMAKKIHLMYADKPVSALEKEFNAAVKLYGQPVPALGAHKNGRSTPIEPRLDYSAQSNADDHPGLGYKCGRWQMQTDELPSPLERKR